MEGYRNGFEIAEGLISTPNKTLKDIRNDEVFRKDRRIMRLVQMLINNIRKWARISVISGLKGLNPFSSDKNAVEAGYYDAKKTSEYKSLTKMLIGALGYNEAYLREEILDKYQVIKNMLVSMNKESNLSALELNSEGFFYDAVDNKTYAVLRPEQVKELKGFAQERDKFGPADDVLIFFNSSGDVVVDADSALVRAYLEKEFLGREKGRREEPVQELKEGSAVEESTPEHKSGNQSQEQSQWAFLHKGEYVTLSKVENGFNYVIYGKDFKQYQELKSGLYECSNMQPLEVAAKLVNFDSNSKLHELDYSEFMEKVEAIKNQEPSIEIYNGGEFSDMMTDNFGNHQFYVDRNTGKAVLDYYVGTEKAITVPNEVEAGGVTYKVGGMAKDYLAGTEVTEVSIDASYWKDIYDPKCLQVADSQFPEVKWTNLTPEMEKQLKENKERALSEVGVGTTVSDKDVLDKTQDKDSGYPNKNRNHKKNKDKGLDI